MPPNASEPTLIRQLSAAAAGAGVDLVSITPGAAHRGVGRVDRDRTGSLTPATSTGNQLVQLPLTLGITGTFPNVESFFQSLEKLHRSTLRDQLGTVHRPGPGESGGSGTVSCSLPPTPPGDALPPNAIGGSSRRTSSTRRRPERPSANHRHGDGSGDDADDGKHAGGDHLDRGHAIDHWGFVAPGELGAGRND